MVYFRWGRVGVKGQDKLNGPYTSQQAAISEFEKKFFDKTKNRWFDRENFVSHPRSYTWLEMDYSETRNVAPVSFFNSNLVCAFFFLKNCLIPCFRAFQPNIKPTCQL